MIITPNPIWFVVRRVGAAGLIFANTSHKHNTQG
jgi:hypothetical protein